MGTQYHLSGSGLKCFLALQLILIGITAQARICNSTGNGPWNHASTWSCGTAPLPGDTVNILAGHTVSQTNNQTYSGTPIHVNVYGVWQFTGGGSKITLPCGSYVEIHVGGSLFPDPDYQGFSETVRICNVTYWNTTMGAQNGYVIWPEPPDPMPVTLVDLDAMNEESVVDVKWITASEYGVERFNVYRSYDGSEKTFVGAQNGLGNSFIGQQYLVKDSPPSSGHINYHLTEVTSTGEEHELGVASVYFLRPSDLLRCTPNPISITDALTIDLPGIEKAVEVRMVGMEGRWLKPATVDLDGSMMIVMDGLHLSGGIYTVQLIESGRVIGTCRIMIQ